jgi:hypothetical protein
MVSVFIPLETSHNVTVDYIYNYSILTIPHICLQYYFNNPQSLTGFMGITILQNSR